MKRLTGHKRTCSVNFEEEYNAVEHPKFVREIIAALQLTNCAKEVERTMKSLRINKLSNEFYLNVFDALTQFCISPCDTSLSILVNTDLLSVHSWPLARKHIGLESKFLKYNQRRTENSFTLFQLKNTEVFRGRKL